MEKRKEESRQESTIKQELSAVHKALLALDKEQQQLLQWALKGFPEKTIIQENEKINKQRAELEKRDGELRRKIEVLEQEGFDVVRVEEFCKLAVENLNSFSYDDKRLALEALHISVQVDGEMISVTGAIPMEMGYIDSTLPAWAVLLN